MRSRFTSALGVAAVLWSLPTQAQVTSRYPAAAYLEVSGTGGLVSIGPRSLVGGEPVADLLVRPKQDGGFDAQPGPVRYSEVVAEVLPAEITTLLRGWLDGSRPRVDGRFVLIDSRGHPLMQRGFSQALITEVTVPALDARRSEPLYLRLRLAPSRTMLQPPGGVSATPAATPYPVAVRLQLDGLDPGSVQGVEEFTIAMTEGKREGVDRFEHTPAATTPSRVSVTVTPAGAAQLTPWHDGFVLAGDNGQSQERSLTFTILSREGRPVLTLLGQGVGILALRRVTKSLEQEAFQADLYVERWAIQ